MIARIRGRPVAHDAEGLVVEVAGVGYRVLATPTVIRKADGADEVVVETHLHVREDAVQLFGFADADERTLFEQLLSVSGVGPKVALAIVSGYSPGELKRAIVREDAKGSAGHIHWSFKALRRNTGGVADLLRSADAARRLEIAEPELFERSPRPADYDDLRLAAEWASRMGCGSGQ